MEMDPYTIFFYTAVGAVLVIGAIAQLIGGGKRRREEQENKNSIES